VSEICLNDALNDVLGLLNSLFSKEAISLSVELLPNLKIRANTSQLQQVFLNLLVNSLHAIKFRATNGPLTQFQVSLKARIVGNFCEISVTDNGCGIPEQNLRHIFEPFFTTKDLGSGTGLGLSIVQQIIFSWNGNIICESKVNQGKAFNLRIPNA
jgi:signal transduction histidine kinase